MKFVRPKVIGTLKVKQMRAGNWAVVNDIKNPPNKIIIQCNSIAEGDEIIEQIKQANFKDILHF